MAEGKDRTILNTDKSTPATSSSEGELGEIRFDANYIYVCVASKTWKRVAISSW